MNPIILLFLLILFGIFPFKKSEGYGLVPYDKLGYLIKDTTKFFIVDDYPISNDLLETNGIKVVGSIGSDKLWFSNDSLEQSIVFELYTDKHRLYTYHFYNSNVPDELIDKMEFHYMNGELATKGDKLKNFNGFIKKSKKITKPHFISNKGFKLGDKKEKALIVYGKPDKIAKGTTVEIYEWIFIGDIVYDGKIDLKGKPLAKNSFGHIVTMYFKDNKLVALVLFNDIP